jgi:phosphatidylinositol alpha 1,6-mannosyltransferase
MNLDQYPRVALFADGFEETVSQLDGFASRHGLPFLSILPDDRSLLRRFFPIRNEIQDFRPDVIHATFPGGMGLLGAHFARTLKIPLVVSWHSDIPVHSLSDWIFLHKLYRSRGIAQVLLGPNKTIVKILHSQTALPTYLMQPGIDTSLFAPLKRVYADGILRIGYVGQLSPEKNVRLLAELERTLRRKLTRPFRFLIVGDGSMRPWLQSNLTNAEFDGALQGEALARAMARMDIFAFPSQTDAFGDTVLKAMASGVPAVVMSKGAPRFVVEDGISGLVALGTEDFNRYVFQLLISPEMRRRMALAARTRANQWSWENACETLYRTYRLAVRSFPIRPGHLPMMPPSPIGLRRAT